MGVLLENDTGRVQALRAVSRHRIAVVERERLAARDLHRITIRSPYLERHGAHLFDDTSLPVPEPRARVRARKAGPLPGRDFEFLHYTDGPALSTQPAWRHGATCAVGQPHDQGIRKYPLYLRRVSTAGTETSIILLEAQGKTGLIVPAARAKAGETISIPLSVRALAILKGAARKTRHPRVHVQAKTG